MANNPKCQVMIKAMANVKRSNSQEDLKDNQNIRSKPKNDSKQQVKKPPPKKVLTTNDHILQNTTGSPDNAITRFMKVM